MTAQSETADWTVRRVLQWTQQRFTARGLGSPRLDAELLLGHSLGWPRVKLYTNYDQLLTADELGRYRELIRRRLGGEPVAYLTGEKEFYSLCLQVTDAVLIPRPETELLVEVALSMLPATGGMPAAGDPAHDDLAPPASPAAPQQVPAEPGVALTVHYEDPASAIADDPGDDSEDDPGDDLSAGLYGGQGDSAAVAVHLPEEAAQSAAAAGLPQAAPRRGRSGSKAAAGRVALLAAAHSGGEPAAVVADVGTGSGAVALALKHSRPALRVLAIDQCASALQVAAQNAERLGLPVEFFHGDLLTPLPPPLRLDLITANLPYIPSADIAALAPEVRSEPPAALDGGPDGLDVIRRLIAMAPLRLHRGGALLLEIGAGQHQAVAALMAAAGFTKVQSHRDLAQIERVVSGRLP